MKKPAFASHLTGQTQNKQPKISSTQSFTEVDDVKEHYVLLKGGNAAVIIEVKSTNFALLSQDEQRIKLLSYASLLNSLSFPIQVLVRSKRVDVSVYIKSLDTAAQQVNFPNITSEQREKISTFITHYKGFVEEMTKVNTVLDKKFYIVIPYTGLEQGAKSALKRDDFFEAARASLKIKAETLLTQVEHLSLRAKILEKDEIISLLYELFNAQEPSGKMGESFGNLLGTHTKP